MKELKERLIKERCPLSPEIILLLSPQKIQDNQFPLQETASFAQITTHLRIKIDPHSQMKPNEKGFYPIEQKLLKEDENPWQTFGAKTGETIWEITIRPDMTLEEFALVLQTIRHQALSYLGEEEKIQAEYWFASLTRRAEELTNTACALYLIEKEIENPNPNFSAIIDFLYHLGQVLDVNQRYQGKKIEEVAAQKEKEDPQGLLRGLRYARWGEKETELRQTSFEEAKNFYAKIYQRLNRLSLSPFSAESIIKNIIDKSLPREVAKSRKDLEFSLVESLVMAGIEELYQNLPLPRWVKEFFQNPQTRIFTLERNLDGEIFIRIATKLGFSFKEINSFFDLPPEIKTKMAEKLYQYLITLDLGKENLAKFTQWFETRGFREMIRNFENQLKKAKNEKERNKIRTKYASLQKQAIERVIAQMRTYPGWKERPFGVLKDSSPSYIAREESLNCVGRTFLLGKVLTFLGFSPEEIFYASSMEHSSLFVFFKDGTAAKIDPSLINDEIHPLSQNLTERIKKELKKRGMKLGIEIDYRYYSLFPFSQGIATAILQNFSSYFLTPKNYLKLTELLISRCPFVNIIENWFLLFYIDSGRPNSFTDLNPQQKKLVLKMIEKIIQVQPDIGQIINREKQKAEANRETTSLGFYLFIEGCFEEFMKSIRHK